MPTPTQLRELPLGVIRGAFGAGRVVLFVDTKLFLHAEIAKLQTSMPLDQRTRRYWVLALPRSAIDRNGSAFVLTPPAPAAVKGSGHNNYDQAETAYEDLARSDTGKQSVSRGLKGLSGIGRED